MPFDKEIADEFCIVQVVTTINPSNAEVKIGDDEYFGTELKSKGELEVRDGPLFISYLNLSMYLIALCLMLFICWIFMQIIRSIEDKIVFTIENARKLKQVAFSLIIFIVLFQAINIGLAMYIDVSFDNQYTTQSILSKGTFTYTFTFGELLFAFFVLMAAEIFKIGVKMKEEQDLTI